MNHSYDQEFKITKAISEGGRVLHSEKPLFVMVNNVGYRELVVPGGHKVTRATILGWVPWYKRETIAEVARQVFFCETYGYHFSGGVSAHEGTPLDPKFDIVRVTANSSPPELGFYDGVSLAVKMKNGRVHVTVLDWGKLARDLSGTTIPLNEPASARPQPKPVDADIERATVHN